MERTNIKTILPLTGPQQAVLFQLLQTGGSGQIQVRFDITGLMDDETLIAAWQDVVARHDALRTTIHMPEGQKPMQVVARSCDLPIESVDLRGLSRAAQDSWIENFVKTDAASDLPLDEVPVCRLVFFRPDDRRTSFLWTVSKLLLDGWSAVVALQDLMACYAARREERPIDLAPVPSFQDYCAALRSASAEESRRFWADMFEGFRDEGRLFGTLPHAAADIGSLDVPRDLWPALEAAARSFGVTPTALVSATWAIFLAASGAGHDVAFALSLSGRTIDLEGVDRMVGPLTTTAPRRASIRPGMSAGDLARDLHRAGLRAQPHEMLSPVEIFGGSDATRKVPIPETLLTVEVLPDHEAELDTDGGVHLSGFRSGIVSGFPLSLVVIPGEDTEIHFATRGLEDEEFARDALARFPALLMDVAMSPHRPVDDFLQTHAIAPPERAAKVPGINGPRNPVELVVAEIWKSVLGIEDIDIERDFAAHGGRSFAAIRVLTRMEETFGERIPMPEFAKAQTVPELARLVMEGTGQETNWRTLVPFRRRGTKPAVIFVHLGAHPVTFLTPFFERLGADRPFLAVQPVGVGGGADPLYSFEDLARIHVDELQSSLPEGPVHVVGNCGGARLAVEVVRQLRGRGREVLSVVAIDTRPPRMLSKPRPGAADEPATQRRRSFSRKLQGLVRFARRELLIRYARAIGRVELEREISAEILEHACYIADNAYRACPMKGALTVVHTLNERPKSYEWECLATSTEHLHLPVGHFTMFFEPEVDTLAKEISTLLHKAEQRIGQN